MSSRSTDRGRRPCPAPLLLGVWLVGVGCGPSPESLMRSGRYHEVLRRVRPVGASALRLRAAALRQQGKLEGARVELGIALSLDDRSSAGHGLMGLVELELGALGSAFQHLRRSLELDARQPEVRGALARLHLRRALLRADPAFGIEDLDEARRDLERARALDRELGALGARRLDELRRAPASIAASRARGEACVGVPASLADAGLPRPGRCRPMTDRLVARAIRRDLLAACNGADLALCLERQGCLSEAQEMWALLEGEAPSDPRWPLQVGRVLLARGLLEAAELRFTDAVFLSHDRSAAELRVGELLLLAEQRRPAGARAVRALALATRLEQQLDAVRLLLRCGLPEAAQQAVATVLGRGWGVNQAALRARLDEIVAELSAARPRTPRR